MSDFNLQRRGRPKKFTMKRRIPVKEPQNSSRNRGSLPGSYRGRRSTGTLSAVLRWDNDDSGCRKTVKVTELGNCSLVADALESCQAMGSDDPKTSEYAFFKKLKEGTSCRSFSQPSQLENLPKKKLKSSDLLRERTYNIEKSCEKLSLPCPVDIAHANDVSLSWPLDNLSQKTGTHERHLEIFSRKREKLRRWVAESSCPDVDKLCSKGYDIVSVLIRRLFPETNVDTTSTDSMSMLLETDTNYKLPSSANTDVCFEKCHQLPERDIVEVEYWPLLDDYSSSRLNVSTKRYLSKFDFSSSFSNYYHCQNRIREPDYDLGERSPIFYTHCDSDLGFPPKKDGYHFLKNLNKLDGCQYPNKSVFESVSRTLFLGWDCDRRMNEKNLSINSRNAELSLYPNSSTSCSDVHQHIVDSSCGANGLCMSSFAFYLPELTPLLSSPLKLPTASECFENYYSSEDFLEGLEYMVADSNNSSFPLLPVETRQNPDEDCNYNMAWKYSSAFLSPQNQDFMHEVLKEGLDYPGTEAIISSGLDFDSAQKWPREPNSSTRYAIEYPQKELISSLFVTTQDKFEGYLDSFSHRGRRNFNFLSDNVVNIHEWLPFQFHRSRNTDETSPFPLLLDKPCWIGSEEETYNENNEDEGFWQKWLDV